MKWFISSIVVIIILQLIASVYMTKLSMREESDAAFHEKMQRIRARTAPVYNVLFNMFWWAFAIGLVYLILRGFQ